MKAASVAAAAAVFSSLAVLSASTASYLLHSHTHTHARILIHISLCVSSLNESLCVIGSITWPQLDIETGASHSHCGRAKVDKHTHSDSIIHPLAQPEFKF